MFWAKSSPDWRSDSVFASMLSEKLTYLPYCNNYYDYDFRNLQAYELLEDLFWENNYLSYNHYDYLNTKLNATKKQVIDLKTNMREPYYIMENLLIDYKDNPQTSLCLRYVL
jgi:hypothetical protein